jgi:hypothetical protein
MFLLPAALLSLDNVRNKRGIIFCLLVLAVFPFYTLTFVTMPALFAIYHIAVARFTRNLSKFVSLVLARAAAVLGLRIEERISGCCSLNN